MTEAKDYLDFLEQHRLMDDAQKYPLVVEYARSCEAEIARLRAALAEQGLLQKKPGGGMVWHAHRAGTDERDHDYTFYASIGTQDKEATP